MPGLGKDDVLAAIARQGAANTPPAKDMAAEIAKHIPASVSTVVGNFTPQISQLIAHATEGLKSMIPAGGKADVVSCSMVDNATVPAEKQHLPCINDMLSSRSR